MGANYLKCFATAGVVIVACHIWGASRWDFFWLLVFTSVCNAVNEYRYDKLRAALDRLEAKKDIEPGTWGHGAIRRTGNERNSDRSGRGRKCIVGGLGQGLR